MAILRISSLIWTGCCSDIMLRYNLSLIYDPICGERAANETMSRNVSYSICCKGQMMMKQLLLLAILAFLARSNASAQSLNPDSLPGRLIKRITTPAQFVSFDKKHNDRFYVRDASDQRLLNEIMVVPEIDCFLANHTKDD